MKKCVLEDKTCVQCGECEVCDLDSSKKCDNCMECIKIDQDYHRILIDEIQSD